MNNEPNHRTRSFPNLEKENGLNSCSRMNNRALAKTSAGKERNEKRNSTGSAILINVSFNMKPGKENVNKC